MAITKLIEPELLRRLERLRLNTNRRFSAMDAGERTSRRRGVSIEFSDFREYRAGDDLRYVDWRAYGRLDRLFLKLFQDEEDLSLHLLIDCSKSMSFGEPMSKWRYAVRAAAAIGFVALHENNRVDVASFNTRLAGKVQVLRGNSGIPAFFSAIERLPEPSGATNFAETVHRYSAGAPPAGIVVVFSDFYDRSLSSGLLSLAARRHQVLLVEVLSRQEVAPELSGDLNLIDAETGTEHEVTLSEGDLRDYHARMTEHTAELTRLAKQYGMLFQQVVTDEPLEKLILHSLRAADVVR